MSIIRPLVIVGILSCLEAQVPQNNHFEVASIKVCPPWNGAGPATVVPTWEGGPGTPSPGRLTIRNYPLATLVVNAYSLRPFQLEGLAAAAGSRSDRFDIDATLRVGTTKQQALFMLQNLLVERFHLRLRRESRQGTVYSVSIGKNGHKLKESATGEVSQSTFVMRGDLVDCRFLSTSMEEFAGILSGQVKAPVRDETGLTGKYDIHLEYQPSFIATLNSDSGVGASSVTGQDIISAVLSQLGLRVERGKGLVDIFVVEHVDRYPVEN